MPIASLQPVAVAAVIAALMQPSAGLAADPAASKPNAAKRSVTKPAREPMAPATKPKAAAEAAAKEAESPMQLTASKLEVADRVLTGEAACEFNQTVSIDRIDNKPGHFRLGFKKVFYTMLPEETTTGAVRLEDKKAGVVWLQIPAKSMLMNTKIGQRMVDACTHSEQRAAVAAVEAAAQAASAASGADQSESLGIAGMTDLKVDAKASAKASAKAGAKK